MLLSLSIAGFFLSLILLYFNAKKIASTIYLGIFFLLVSLYSFNTYTLAYSKSVFLISLLTVNFAFLYYLIGPMLYWYIRSVLTDDYRLKKRDLLHLLPMAVYFISSLSYIFTPWSYKLEIAKSIVKDVTFIQEIKFTILSEIFSVHALYLSRPLLVLAYTLWSAGIFIGYMKNRGELLVFSRQHFMTKWLSYLLGFQTILVVSHTLLMLKPVSVFVSLNILQIISGVGLIGLLVTPFFFPNILYGLPRIPEPDSGSKAYRTERKIPIENNKKYAPEFESDYLFSISQKANSCMQELQPYLKADFNLTQFSVLIHVPVHHLLYYFREERKQSFTDYRNGFRLYHAKKLIREGKAAGLTLEAIGLLSGFSTRNAFFTAFKRAEGISPGVFVAQYSA
jgi:AraC-like DNA-binding protein